MQSIGEEDSVSLSENFNKMAANCGTCHKKFLQLRLINS